MIQMYLLSLTHKFHYDKFIIMDKVIYFDPSSLLKKISKFSAYVKIAQTLFPW